MMRSNFVLRNFVGIEQVVGEKDIFLPGLLFRLAFLLFPGIPFGLAFKIEHSSRSWGVNISLSALLEEAIKLELLIISDLFEAGFFS